MPDNSQEVRVAIITGGAKGLGRAIADRLMSDGLRVAVFASDLKGGREKRGPRLSVLRVDVADPQQVRGGVASVLKTYGRLDVLVNNAGISGPVGPVQEISEADWKRTIDVNLTGAFLCCKYAVPRILESGPGGRIVNISSRVWKKGAAFRTSYSASKAGLVGFTRALSKELGGRGVTVNTISPGPIEGERIHEVSRLTAAAKKIRPSEVEDRLLGSSILHRFSTPQEVAALVSFLVSREGGFITGQEFDADAT